MSIVNPSGLITSSFEVQSGQVKPLGLPQPDPSGFSQASKVDSVASPVLSSTSLASLLASPDKNVSFSVSSSPKQTPPRSENKRRHAESLANSSPANLQTPPQPINRRNFSNISPSIQASPAPNPMTSLHSARNLPFAKSSELKGLNNKNRHSLATTATPEKDAQLVRSHYGKLSRASKQIQKHGSVISPLKVDPHTKIHVTAPDQFEVEHADSGKKRRLSIHRQTDNANKSVHITEGDNVLVFDKNSPDKPSPRDLRQMVLNYKSNPTGKGAVEDYIKDQYDQIVTLSSTSSTPAKKGAANV